MRELILTATVNLVDGIEKKILEFEEPDGPSTSLDDVRARNSTNADRDPSERGVS